MPRTTDDSIPGPVLSCAAKIKANHPDISNDEALARARIWWDKKALNPTDRKRPWDNVPVNQVQKKKIELPTPHHDKKEYWKERALKAERLLELYESKGAE